MPKAKTHSGASKRFRRHRKRQDRPPEGQPPHLLEHKASKRTRRLDGRATVAAKDARASRGC